jgi:hypothetical protein
VLPDTKISKWPFLAQKMPKSVKKEKSPQNQILYIQNITKFIVDTQPNVSQIRL